MDIRQIRLGEKYWCVIKTSAVDPNQKEYPDFLIHLAHGYVTAKGAQKLPGTDRDATVLFVEIAGQRVKPTHVFENPEDAIEAAEAMMSEISDGLKALPPQS